MRRRLVIAAAAAVAAALLVWIALPPRAAVAYPPADDPRVVRGAIHVHTVRSDGTGSVEEVAAAARRAGLQFLVLTDHGDGTRAPDPPSYRAGVLCLDGVEISTTAGHYVALGLQQTPYRLAGEPRDVVEDVRRLGGFGFVAHPDSPKPDLRWEAWDTPFDGLEWLNADSEWRDESPLAVARALTTYLFRGPETIAMLFDRPARTLARWDALNRERRVVGLAGHDAHARIGLRGNWEPARGDVSIRAPSYEAAFRAFAVRVRLDGALTGDASRDAGELLDGIRHGRVHTVVDALAQGGWLEVTAAAGEQTVGIGADLPTDGRATIRARVSEGAGISLALIRNGVTVARTEEPSLLAEHEAAAGVSIYRVEAHHAGAPGGVPWIVSNPIRIGAAAALRPAAPVRDTPPPTSAAAIEGTTWRAEHDAASRVVLEPDASHDVDGQRLTYTLGAGEPAGQYAAAVLLAPRGSLQSWDRLAFRARAHAPMRVSVQLRDPGTGRRWTRSVYVHTGDTHVVVPFAEMTGVEGGGGAPALDRVDSMLFVVDTTNTRPGATGAVWIGGVRLERTGEVESSGPQVRTVSSR